MKLYILLFSLFLNIKLYPQTNQHNISSKILGEDRLVQVALPKSYDPNKAYSVLYVLDAEYAFDYAKGAVSFLTNAYGFLPEMILVGIPNTDRGKDFYSDEGVFRFIRFMKSELMPKIQSRYKTNGFNLIYGWSSSADLPQFILENEPELADAYIQSGSGLGAKGKVRFLKNVEGKDYSKKYLYGNAESNLYQSKNRKSQRIAGLERYKSVLEENPLKGLRWKLEIPENTSHVGVIAEGLSRGLKFVFKDFFVPDSISKKSAEAIINYYKMINLNYSADFLIPVGALNESAFILFVEKKADEAIKLLKHGISLHPNSTGLLASLAEVYEYSKQPKESAKLYKKALDLSEQKVDKLKYKSILKKFN